MISKQNKKITLINLYCNELLDKNLCIWGNFIWIGFYSQMVDFHNKTVFKWDSMFKIYFQRIFCFSYLRFLFQKQKNVSIFCASKFYLSQLNQKWIFFFNNKLMPLMYVIHKINTRTSENKNEEGFVSPSLFKIKTRTFKPYKKSFSFSHSVNYTLSLK